MLPLHYRSARSLVADLHAGEIGARELLEHFLARADSLNPKINAIIAEDRTSARAQADAADTARTRGQAMGPLFGLPMTIKESYNLAGLPTTWGMPTMRKNIAKEDALAVQRLKAAGAIVFGKTNVPLSLADFQSYNEVYGTTNNPWHLERTPGGSSGGSAAALAAGLTGLEMGSDIGGSIRNPAHFCGVFGHRPTWNLVPPRGHALGNVLSSTDIAVVGPLARSAFDLEIAMQLTALPDELETAGVHTHLVPLSEPLQTLRIAVWSSDPLCPTSKAVSDKVEAVAQALSKQGAQVDREARPAFTAEHSHGIFQGLLMAAMAARLPDAEYEALVKRADTFDPSDKSPAAAMVRAQTMRVRNWIALNDQRTHLRWAWQRFFADYDFMITPIMPTTAFAHNHAPFGERKIEIDGKLYPYFAQTFWAGLPGVTYLPATVIPAGLGPDGLPIGVQIIGPAYGDRRTIQLAQRLEQLGFCFRPPPSL